jgi:6-pyruvoyltetrahydropterin/6-carboxytetrahydropterin synthase
LSLIICKLIPQLYLNMISITKIFHFETAHALYGYNGPCRNIHGHSYELHVTVTTPATGDTYIEAPGFIIDFKQLKQLVKKEVVERFDHKLILSGTYLKHHPLYAAAENLEVWDVEPSAENMLIFTKNALIAVLPTGTSLQALRLYETKGSYAEWVRPVNYL